MGDRPGSKGCVGSIFKRGTIVSRTSRIINLTLIESRVSAIHEASYIPFLFGGSSQESNATDKLKGRRVFGGQGVEVTREVSSSTTFSQLSRRGSKSSLAPVIVLGVKANNHKSTNASRPGNFNQRAKNPSPAHFHISIWKFWSAAWL